MQARAAARRVAGAVAKPGHLGHGRYLVPTEHGDEVFDYHPAQSGNCCCNLSGAIEGAALLCHQDAEISRVRPIVMEYGLHQLTCPCCLSATRPVLPDGVETSGFGAPMAEMVYRLWSNYLLSHLKIQRFVKEG